MDNFTLLCRARERRLTRTDARMLLTGLREVRDGLNDLIDTTERLTVGETGARAIMAVHTHAFLNVLVEFGLVTMTTETAVEATEKVAL